MQEHKNPSLILFHKIYLSNSRNATPQMRLKLKEMVSILKSFYLAKMYFICELY